MGAITVCGKGSRNRVRNRKKYAEHFDAIKWGRTSTARKTRIKGGKITYVY